MTNYERLFGSPERVAVTFAAIGEWLNEEVTLSPSPGEGKEWFTPSPYYMLGETLGVNFGDDSISFLEWLLGGAE